MNKRLLITSCLLLVCLFGAANFSLHVFADSEGTQAEAILTDYNHTAPTPTPTICPTETPTPTEIPSPTPTSVPTVTPTATATPVPQQSQSQTQTTNVYNTQIVETKVIETTKGGHPVYAPKPIKRTPDTGAEAITLFSLIPSSLAGFILRKKIS